MNRIVMINLNRLFGIITVLYVFSLICGCGMGGVKSITDAELVGDKICFLDEYYTGKKNPKKTYTLYVVDISTGELLNSEKIGYDAKLLISSISNLLIAVADKFVIYNTCTLSSDLIIDNEYLTNNFPELSEGVSKIEFIYNRLSITTKSGLIYLLEPFSSVIELKSKSKPIDIVDYRCYYTKAYIFDNGVEKPLFTIKSKTNGEDRLYVKNVSNSLISGSQFSVDYFLEGSFVNMFWDEKMLIVKSYTTTDREAQQLSCLDFDLKTLWKITSTDLRITEKEIEFVYSFKKQNFLYANIGTYWLCIDSRTGDVSWTHKF